MQMLTQKLVHWQRWNYWVKCWNDSNFILIWIFQLFNAEGPVPSTPDFATVGKTRIVTVQNCASGCASGTQMGWCICSSNFVIGSQIFFFMWRKSSFLSGQLGFVRSGCFRNQVRNSDWFQNFLKHCSIFNVFLMTIETSSFEVIALINDSQLRYIVQKYSFWTNFQDIPINLVIKASGWVMSKMCYMYLFL